MNQPVAGPKVLAGKTAACRHTEVTGEGRVETGRASCGRGAGRKVVSRLPGIVIQSRPAGSARDRTAGGIVISRRGIEAHIGGRDQELGRVVAPLADAVVHRRLPR